MIKNILIVFIGGGAGSVLRYLTSVLTGRNLTAGFPMPTFLVNVAGCLIIGIVTGLYLKNSLSSADTKLLLVTGFCGGFTTFSAFAQENLKLMQEGQLATAIIYTTLSVVLGIAFVWLGLLITK